MFPPFEDDDPDALQALGQEILYCPEPRLHPIEDAEKIFRMALELAPGRSNLLLDLAVAVGSLGRENEEISLLQEAIANAQDNETLAEAHLRLGLVYWGMGNETLVEVELGILRGLDAGSAELLEEVMKDL